MRASSHGFDHRVRRAVRRQRGMSIIEVLIAALLLLVIAIGILPLMTRAIANNVRGWEATIFANETKGWLEKALSDPVSSAELTVASGSDENTLTQSWATGDLAKANDVDEGWHDGAPDGKGTFLYERERRVRNYHLKKLLGNPVQVTDDQVWVYEVDAAAFEDPVSGGESGVFKHLTGVDVLMDGLRQGGGLGATQKMNTQYLKSI